MERIGWILRIEEGCFRECGGGGGQGGSRGPDYEGLCKWEGLWTGCIVEWQVSGDSGGWVWWGLGGVWVDGQQNCECVEVNWELLKMNHRKHYCNSLIWMWWRHVSEFLLQYERYIVTCRLYIFLFYSEVWSVGEALMSCSSLTVSFC